MVLATVNLASGSLEQRLQQTDASVGLQYSLKAAKLILDLKQYTHIYRHAQKACMGTSLTAQWLRLCASTAGSMASIPGWGIKIPQVCYHVHTYAHYACMSHRQHIHINLYTQSFHTLLVSKNLMSVSNN